MKNLLLTFFLLSALTSNACLNIFAVDSSGNVHYLEHYFFSEIAFKQDVISDRIKKLEKQFRNKNYSFQNISDYGAYLLMAGRFSEGLDLFRALGKKYPDVYEIRANTAVAYELNGNIDSALYWERSAMSLQTGRHAYSEWIHMKILEAKKQLQMDPGWCLKNNVTGIEDSIRINYEVREHEDGKGLFMLKDFISQMNERLPFTYGEDKVLGKLLFELGNAYRVASVHRSYYCYAMAKYFYPALQPLADEQMQKIKSIYSTPSAELQQRMNALGKVKTDAEKEKLPPDDAEVKKFINRMINREPVKNRKIDPVPVQQLIEKI